MKTIPSLIALAAISVLGISCKSNKTAQNTQQGAQAYGTADDYYGSNGEYDNVYASGGGQSYEDASAYENNTDAYGGAATDYGSGDSYSGGGGASSSGGSQSHTVQKGDTLFNLSRRYGTTVGAIQSANGLNGDLIRIGETLVIP